uniref:PPUP7055 n=1 Tax=Poeciliopsis prolifica TaxID=188132 RepID=A0A0S7EZR2_9TELE
MQTKESAGEIDIAALKRKRGQAKAAVTKMMTSANEKIRENKPEELKSVLESLDLALAHLQEVHKCYHSRLTDDIDREESDAYERLIIMNIHDVRHEALAWLQEKEEDGASVHSYVDDELDVTTQAMFSEPPADINDEDSAAAELEKIQALRKKVKENFELLLRRNKEEFELELQRLHHKAELDAQMQHNQQKMQAFTADLHSTPKIGKIPTTQQPSPFQMADDSISQLLEFSRQHYQAQVDTLRLPPTDLIKFDGEPLQYWKFMRLFTTMVDKESISAEEKLTRLHQYTEGKARDAISHCLYNSDPNAGFKEALDRLKSRFGNPHSISQAWVEKVLNFKEIRDNLQLRDFADLLRGCKDTLAAMKCEEELSGRRTLFEIISKLPSDLRAKWLNKNYDITKEGHLPKLNDVVNFVETEAEKRSDPVFGGLIGFKKYEKPNNFTSPTKVSKKHRQSYPTTVKAAAVCESKSARTKQPAYLKCLKCSEQHFLNQCPGFRSLTVPERLVFVQEKNLCQNCFMIGHSAEICTRNWVCNVPGCGQKHNKWLHPNHTNRQETAAGQDSTDDTKTTQRTQPSRSPNVTCGFAGAANGKVCLPIVPVVVRGKATNINSVTYALLDPGANTSLVSEELTKKLKVKGKPARLELDTVGGSQS